MVDLSVKPANRARGEDRGGRLAGVYNAERRFGGFMKTQRLAGIHIHIHCLGGRTA